MGKKRTQDVYSDEEDLEITKDDLLDAEIDSEDDEEIEEDLAFDEEDEERYGMYFSKSNKNDSDEESDDEDIDEDLDDGAIDISELLGKDEDVVQYPKVDDDLDSDPEDTEVAEKLVNFVANLDNENPVCEDKTEKKLNIESLLSAFSGESFGGNLIKKVQSLESKQKSLVVDAPLAPRIQNRIDRQVAYEDQQRNMNKWTGIIQQNRKADVLDFTKREQRINLSSASLAATFQPQNDMEKEIQSALEAHGLTEEQIRKGEELEMREMDIEEVRQKRAELQKLRSLMFFQEQKLKRISKIKSKKYRKILKKEKLRQLEKEGVLEDDDRMEKEIERARERMTLRHRSNNKWVKNGMKMNNPGQNKAALEAQLRRADELERKIKGNESEEESETEIMESIQKMDEELPQKGIFAMKFMRDAALRERQEAMKSLNEDDNIEEETGNVKKIQNNPGRVQVKAKSAVREKESGSVNVSSKAHVTVVPQNISIKPLLPTVSFDDEIDDDVIKFDEESFHSIKKDDKKETRNQSDSQNPWLEQVNAPLQKSKLKKEQRKDIEPKEIPINVNISESIDESNLLRPQINQKDLVMEAFANDDVVQEFENEKEEIMKDEESKEVDETLPGWDSWGGSGIEAPKRKKIKKIEGIDRDERKDSKLKHVIINEKKCKGAAKYMVDKVPYPFQTREQYERSLQLPMGKEWMTTLTFQKLVKPKVITHSGIVIDPIKYTPKK